MQIKLPQHSSGQSPSELLFGQQTCLELAPFKCLAEMPPGWDGVVAGDRPAVAGGHLEGQALAGEVRVALPVLAPVARHRLPPGFRPLDGDGVHVSGTAHIAH